jgi:hypothetical protein
VIYGLAGFAGIGGGGLLRLRLSMLDRCCAAPHMPQYFTIAAACQVARPRDGSDRALSQS